MRSSMTGACGFSVGSLAAISVVERYASGPAPVMISSKLSSMAALRVIGRTEKLASCKA